MVKEVCQQESRYLSVKLWDFTDYSHGFGGKFGVQDDRKDKSAVGWDYVETPQKHESQMDHKVVSKSKSKNHFKSYIFLMNLK